MKKSLLAGLFLLASIKIASAQSKEDVNSIKAMCGCYEVSFSFIETFSSDTAYKNHKAYKTSALEWIQVIGEKPGELSLQHLLITLHAIIKHWRQDWSFQSQERYKFNTPGHWDYLTASKGDVKGQWTQRVFEVDDSPRYQASGSWIHLDGKNYWEATTDAPLPRREYTKRDDYNVMRRMNRHEITSTGHLHDQYNWKINRTKDGDKLLVEEKGINTYKKVEDKKCKEAQDWWAVNHLFWDDVRVVWADVLDRDKDLKIQWRVEDKFLYEHLFEMAENYAKLEKKDSAANRIAIRKIMDQYLDKEMPTAQQKTMY